MKSFIAAATAAIFAVNAFGQAEFDRYGIQYRARVPLASMPGTPTSGAGCTGYVSPSGREYAIMGVRNGTVIYDITSPAVPTLINRIAGVSSLWHENASLNAYGYFVTDSSGNGMQIVDLRNVDGGTAPLVSTYTGNGLATVHTIQANPASNTLFLNGSNLAGGGIVMLDASNPAVPVEVGRWSQRYVHDCYPVTFTSGPYAGREIVFACCGGSGLYIIDVTNKANPVTMSSRQYLPSGTYCHSGVLTPDGRYFLVNDEFDEQQGQSPDCSTHIFDVSNLSNPVYLGKFVNPINAIDHNTRWKDGYIQLAAYRQGIRIYDGSNPLALRETGFFDSAPNSSGFDYSGAWGSFIFPSGNSIISDMERGLFVVDPTEAMGLGAVPLSLTMSQGTYSGELSSVRKSDSVTLSMNNIAPAGSRSISGTFAFETTRMPATAANLAVLLRSTGASGQLTIEGHRFTTDSWFTLGTFNLSGDLQTNLNLPLFLISNTGRIEIRLTFTGSAISARTMSVVVDQLVPFVNWP